MRVQGAAMLIRWWDGPPVVLFVPSSEPICIRKTKSSGRLECKIPLGQYAGSHSHKKEDGFL
jgi:hypothetical protein